MPTRKVQRRPFRHTPIGDRRELIRIHTRGITAPAFGSASFSESYDAGILTWASVTALGLAGSGQRLFDGVQMAVTPTHIFDIRYRPNITAENIIHYQTQYYQILYVNDPENRHILLMLYAALKGDDTLEVNT